MSSASKAQGAALCESHNLGILFLSFKMNREHRLMLVPHQDSSISGRIQLAQCLAAAPCPEGTSCPGVTVRSVPWPWLSARTLLTAEQGEGSISRESCADTPWLPGDCPPALECDFQHHITFTALELGAAALGQPRCLLVMRWVLTALLLLCCGPSLPA